MDARQREALLRKIMDVERRFSVERRNAKSDRKVELRQLIDSFVAEMEVEKNAHPQG